jgi:acetyl-CoA carboxylase biotin carboxyl carrier protein
VSGGLTPEEVAAILRVIDDVEFKEISVRMGDLSISMRRGEPDGEPLAAPAPPAQTASAPAPPAQTASAPAPPAQTASAPAPTAAPTPALPPPAGDGRGGNGAEPGQTQRQAVVSPLLGTFYRRASPGEDPFVDVGSEVDEKSVVCIVEVMKMMNSIQAGVTGRVVEVLVEDGQLVESGAELFVVEPSTGNGTR